MARSVYARFTLDLRSCYVRETLRANFFHRSIYARVYARVYARSEGSIRFARVYARFTLVVTLSLRSNSLDLRSDPFYARFTLAVTLDLRADNERNEERNAERKTERRRWHCEPRA